MNSTNSIQFIVAMITMMNPLGSLSIFLDLTRKSSLLRQRRLALQISLAIFILMVLTVWIGSDLLSLFGITISSFRFAGGIILLLMGLSMLQSKESPVNYTSEDDIAAKEKHSVAIVPMALPVIVGPGAISTIIITVGDYPEWASRFWISILCITLTLMMGLLLYYSSAIVRFVGMSLIKVITRIMGMIIMAIASNMLADGLMGLLPILKQ